MTTPHDPTMSHSSLDPVIAAYMQSVEAGEVPNRQELLDQHPAIAEKLHAFFADVIDGRWRVANLVCHEYALLMKFHCTRRTSRRQTLSTRRTAN